jgi:hypothetical protein
MELRGEVSRQFAIGTLVEVRDRFRGLWSRGFSIAGAATGGCWIRRISDRDVLPVMFVDDDIRGAS